MPGPDQPLALEPSPPARRDELVRRLHACGDSTRVIADLAGVSHTQVRRIVA